MASFRLLIAFLLMLAGCGASQNSSDGATMPDSAVPLGGGLFLLGDGEEGLLLLDGSITPETAFVFQALVAEADVNGLVISQSPGGTLRAAHQIGRTIRENNINTLVLLACASACVEVFAAGRNRAITDIGVLLLHSPSDRQIGFAIGKPYWDALGFPGMAQTIFDIPEGQVLLIRSEQAVSMGLANESVRPAR